jgi:hypothetical protein
VNKLAKKPGEAAQNQGLKLQLKGLAKKFIGFD